MNKNKINWVAVLTMMFLFGMISFVTNLAAPIGTVWKNQPGIDGSNFWGMMGNMMNFLAYLFMGLPAGKLILKYGYKRTTLIGVAVGFFGVLIQFLSGKIGVGASIAGLPANFFVYLLGAFISGFSVCILNTVVNPMLNLLGGSGNKGNQLVQIGGTFNSLTGTLTPMLVMAMIGEITKKTAIVDVNPVLYIAMGVFAVVFAVLVFVPFVEPEQEKSNATVKSLLVHKHLVYGVIAIFLYVGVEVGIPGTLNFYLTTKSKEQLKTAIKDNAQLYADIETLEAKAADESEDVKKFKDDLSKKLCGKGLIEKEDYKLIIKDATKIKEDIVKESKAHQTKIDDPDYQEGLGMETGFVGTLVGLYWLLMLVGRFVSSLISSKVSSKTQLTVTCSAALILVVAAIFTSGASVTISAVPLTAILLICCGLCTSVMWGTIFNLSVEGLGKNSALASGLFMTMVVGGGVLPLVQNAVADAAGFMTSYWVIVAALAYMLWFAVRGSKVKTTK